MTLQPIPQLLDQAATTGTLDLGGQQLTALPAEIWSLTQLERLYLDHNQLTTLPLELAQLAQLKVLSLSDNLLRTWPPVLSQLSKLEWLYLANNQLTELPPIITALNKLTVLVLTNNRLKELPNALTQLSQLQVLSVENNPLFYPPPEILVQGTPAILTYLEKSVHGRRQWLGKVMVVGEAGGGKTAVIRALQGQPLVSTGSAIPAMEIQPWELKHPSQPKTTMQLKTWDCGGALIYHAIHSLFLTHRTLFLLVWNARLGYELSKLPEWLNLLQAKAPDSPVLLVATHVENGFEPVLPWHEWQQKYPQLRGYYKVSNQRGEGIEILRQAISETAAKLPLMGELWPPHWIAAAQAIRNLQRHYLTPQQLQVVMMDNHLTPVEGVILSKWLHELGDLWYFQEAPQLNQLVILKPQWMIEYLNRAVTSTIVVANKGILTHNHLNELWRDLDLPLREHFLRVMEHLDLSYRSLDRHTNLVVECLPLDSPEHLKSWQKMSHTKELRMTYHLNTLPPGIPTWFIARTRRFSTNTHWRYGALLAHRHHFGLIQVSPAEKTLELAVRGPHPHHFFAMLRDTLELTLQRYPGLSVQRQIPCMGHHGQPCGYEFNYAVVDKAMSKGVSTIQCHETFEQIAVAELSFGLDWHSTMAVLQKIEELNKIPLKEIQERRRYLVELSQRQIFHLLPADWPGPYFFSLEIVEPKGWQQVLMLRNVKLQWYCQGLGAETPHPMTNGCYIIPELKNWVPVLPIAIFIGHALLTYSPPPTPPNIENWRNWEKLGKPFISTEVIKNAARWRSLGFLLNRLDPVAHWGGLQKVVTPEGSTLWLCPFHAQEWQKRNG